MWIHTQPSLKVSGGAASGDDPAETGVATRSNLPCV